MALYMQGSYIKPKPQVWTPTPGGVVGYPQVILKPPYTGAGLTGPTYNTTGETAAQAEARARAEAEARARAEAEARARAEAEARARGGGDGGGGGGGASESYSAPAVPEIDLSGIWETAGQMADNEINPQLAEIDRQLQQAGYSADESQRAINEAYPVARRSLQKSLYENMVAGEGGLAAMGTGRGGGRQELVARAGEREATGIEAIETQKQRESGAIERALSNYKGQLGTTKTSLQGQRGALQNTYAEQLRGNRFNEFATMANIGLQRDQLAQNAAQFNASLAENTRQFDFNNTPLPGTSGTSGVKSNASTGGLNYFLSDSDLAALGLGVKKSTGTGGTVKATGDVILGYTSGVRKSSSGANYTSSFNPSKYKPAIANW